MEPRRRLPAVVVWLGLVSLLNDVGTEMVYPLLPLFLSDVLHAPRLFIGTIEGAAEATASLLKLIAGRLTDSFPRRKPFTVVGYGMSAVLRPVLGLVTAPMQVLVLRVSDRFGKGVRTSARDALLADAAPHALRGRAYGFHQAMDNAGAIVGPLAATALLGAGIALRNVFLLTAVPGVLTMCALVFGVKEAPRDPAAIKPLGVIEDRAARTALARCIVAVVIFGLGNSSDAFLLLRAQSCGIALKVVPLVWMAHNTTKALLSTWGGALSDRIDRRRVIVVGWAIYGAVYLAFGAARAPWHIWVLFVAYGVYYALTEGAMKALVADFAPAHARGRAFGWYNAAVGLVALPASLGFGALADRFGPQVPFTVSAILALVAAGWLTIAVPRPTRADA